MYLDILSPDNYGQYNRKLAQLTSIGCACYWSELLQICGKVIKKNTFGNDGFFSIDRKYITKQTAISETEQITFDKVLANLGILDTDSIDQNRIRVRLELYTALIAESDPAALKTIAAAAESTLKKKRTTKREGAIIGLKKAIDSRISNQYIREAMYRFVEVVYDKGLVRPTQINLFIDSLEHYTSDLNVQLQLVNIATLNAYKELSYSINIYEQNLKKGITFGRSTVTTAIEPVEVEVATI